MITSLWIDNFKSLNEFELRLERFVCLVGLNGSGKSTVLQVIDLLSQLMRGDLELWLVERQWVRSDINSKLSRRLNIDFRVAITLNGLGDLVWEGSLNRKSLHCTYELVTMAGRNLLKVDEGYCTLKGHDRFPVIFEYQGSILSQLKSSQLSEPLVALRDEVLGIRSLDLLSPESLRLKTRDAGGDLGLGGKKLAAFIHESGSNGKQDLLMRLQRVYPQLTGIETRSLRSGWKQLEIEEQFNGQKLPTIARHVNDGMLRLMAILAQLHSSHQFLLFDEIENGINSELVEFLVDALLESSHQVMVTTHSPVILNYLDIEVAKKSVIYLYRTAQGATRAIRLFDIPSLREKLDFLGPGEAFMDTDLKCLVDEITQGCSEGV